MTRESSAVRLEATTPGSDPAPLGTILEFRLHKPDPAVESRFLLKHEGVFYTRPLRDWSRETSLKLFPEAPGEYRLILEWRSPGGDGGSQELAFSVVASAPVSLGPVKIELRDRYDLWVPSDWEAKAIRDSEQQMLDFLSTLVEPGMVIYDLGANLGIYAIHLAELVGTGGYVYCFEANPVCVQFLRANLIANALHHVEILPVAVLDRVGEVSFSLNYGNSNIGVSTSLGHQSSKVGHEIRVPCFDLDHLIETFGLRCPDLIKIDIEGAEDLAVAGMKHTLRKRLPLLVLELHGEICAHGTLESLDPMGYRYRDPKSGEELTSAAQVCRRFAGGGVFQLLALPPKRP